MVHADFNGMCIKVREELRETRNGNQMNVLSHKKLLSFCVLVFCLSSARAGALGLFMPGDGEVDDLVRLYAASGFVFPAESYPMPKRTLLRYADRLSGLVSDPELQARIDDYIGGLGYEEGAVRAGVSGAYHIEGYYRTDDNWADFRRLYLETPPFAEIAFSGIDEGLGGAYAEIDLRREYLEPGFSPTNLFGTDDRSPIATENLFVGKGMLFLLAGPVELALGREEAHFGSGEFSSLLLSKDLPFYDAFSLKLPLGPFQLTWYVASLDNHLTMDEETYIATNPGGLDWTYPVGGAGGTDDWDYGFETTSIFAAMHRFEYSFAKVRAAVTGLSIVARENNALVLGDFFPVTSWHNTEVGVHNLSLVFDISASPLPGLSLSAMAGYDDINSEEVFGFGDRDIPTIDAYVLGASYRREVKNLGIRGSFEFGKTHYLWGNYWGPENETYNYVFERAVYRVVMDHDNRLMPLTSPYGPGALWFKVKLGAELASGLSLGSDFLFLRTTDGVNLLSTPYERNDSLESAPTTDTVVWGLPASSTFRDWLTLTFEPTLFHREGDGFWFEFSLGLSGRYGAFARIDD
jgi:hypothetical protein